MADKQHPTDQKHLADKKRPLALFSDKMRVSFIVLGTILILFVAWPLLRTITSSSPAILWQTLLDREVHNAILLTFYTSLVATGIAFVCGVPLAYLLARVEFPGKQLIEGIIDVPVVVPHSAGEGFEAVDPRLERVARTLGASPWEAFWRISFPLAWRSILAGMILMWARGLSEFGAVVILAYHPMVAPVLLYERFESFGLKYARPVATLVILICLTAFVALRLTAGRKRDGT